MKTIPMHVVLVALLGSSLIAGMVENTWITQTKATMAFSTLEHVAIVTALSFSTGFATLLVGNAAAIAWLKARGNP